MPRNVRAPLIMVVLLCGAFILSHFYRTSVGVIGPDLMETMGLSAEALGALGGTFFLVFAAAQVPAGVLLDRLGPRRVHASLLLIAALGALIFAVAQDPGGLVLGRGLIGLGCATGLMAALVFFSRWYPPQRFPTFAAMMLGIGHVGALMATTPFAALAETLGWRGAFAAMCGLTAVIAGLIWLILRDAPDDAPFHGGRTETLAEAVRGVGEVLRHRELHLMLPINAVSYASVATVLGVWGAPYLRDVHGLSIVAGADVLMALTIGLIAGSLIYGTLAPRIGRLKPMSMVGATGCCILYALLAVLPPASPIVLLVLFALIGLLAAYAAILVSHVRMLFPVRLVGRGLTVANLFNFGGVGLMQVISGWIVGAFPLVDGIRPAAAYSALFWFLFGLVGTATLIYSRCHEPTVAKART